MAMVKRQMHQGFHSLGQLSNAALAGDLGLGEQRERPVAAKSRMHAGDEIDRLFDPEPRRQHRDIGDETRLLHQRSAIAERFPAQHAELPS